MAVELSQLNINGKKLMDSRAVRREKRWESCFEQLEECLRDRLENTLRQLEQAAKECGSKGVSDDGADVFHSQVAQMLTGASTQCAFMRRA